MALNFTQPYWWLTKDSRKFLSKDYLTEGQTPEDRLRELAYETESHFGKEYFDAETFLLYVSLGFYSFATPIWCNAFNDRGLPISCFGSYISDTMESILDVQNEVGLQTKTGGGTSAYFGAIRPRGSKIGNAGGTSFGAVHFMQLFETTIKVVSQSNVRRGAFAAYLPVDHPDIEEFLKIQDQGNVIQKISIGVTITDEWMESMVAGDKQKRKIWKLIVDKKFKGGFPYIVFIDTINRNKPDVYKFHDMMIWASNLCTEIALPASDDESFVCNLSSMNDMMFDEWKGTDAVRYLVWFLDYVQTDFIEKASKIKGMRKSVNFASRHRALGIGRLGWHSCLQRKGILFESFEAKMLNVEIQETIKKQSYAASAEMFKIHGASDLMAPFGRRHATLMAIAPTLSSAFIHGQITPGTQPWLGNIYIENNAKGNWTVKNPFFAECLKKYGKDKKEIWQDVLKHGGSCQHLDFLTPEDKEMFKIWGEISQKEIIIQAAGRQKHIDQTQSTNLMVHPKVSPKDVSKLMIEAWKIGVPSLYYQYGTNPAQEHQRNFSVCESCSG